MKIRADDRKEWKMAANQYMDWNHRRIIVGGGRTDIVGRWESGEFQADLTVF